MLRVPLLLSACWLTAAWNPNWTSRPSWFSELPKTEEFPLDPKTTTVQDYVWGEKMQRAQLETEKGAVYFRNFVPEEVFASQLAEYLGICVAKSRYIPYGGAVNHGWQDSLQDTTTVITETTRQKVEFLFEAQAGLQEVEFIDGAIIDGYQAKHGYGPIMFDIGRLFAFDIFINDPHNCRFCECPSTGHIWTCKDNGNFNFVVSPTRGVCGHTRAYQRMDITSDKGLKFREFFQLAKTLQTDIEMSKQLAYVVGEMFGENLSMDRRMAAEEMLKGARSTLKHLTQLSGEVFHEIMETSGLHESFAFGLGERLRTLRIILGDRPELHESDTIFAGDNAETGFEIHTLRGESVAKINQATEDLTSEATEAAKEDALEAAVFEVEGAEDPEEADEEDLSLSILTPVEDMYTAPEEEEDTYAEPAAKEDTYVSELDTDFMAGKSVVSPSKRHGHGSAKSLSPM